MADQAPGVLASAPSVGSVSVLRSSSLDKELLIALGRITVSWGQLDFTLRLLLKRLASAAWKTPCGDIIESLPHQKLVDRVDREIRDRSESWPEAERLLTLVRTVGAGRHEGLYGRRNELAHAAWFLLQGGEVVSYRLGSMRGINSAHEAITLSQDLEKELECLARELKLLSDTMPTELRG